MDKHCRLAAGLILTAGLAVSALPAGAQQRGDCGVAGSSVFQEYENSPDHQKKLHDALKITASQEPAWKKYMEAVQSPRPEPKPATNWSSMTAPDRVDLQVEMAKRHEEYLSKEADAMKAFYATLNPDQKKTFDQFHGGARRGS
ncbi:MAG TPA: Spy/CpxP family protein refolding chaperone [Rhodocyclaceae bacterium]|nr:Spy/CpxP family protein refolding chaperone [Rhodocyclaceae bacterium]